MTYWLSQPIQQLLHRHDVDPDDRVDAEEQVFRVDTLLVGSGYGAAMAAIALAEKHRGSNRATDSESEPLIWVFERGNEYVPGDFPKTIGDLPGYVSFVNKDGERKGNADGLFDFRVGESISALVGSGLGGTSLINANVAMRPKQETFARWPALADGTPWNETLSSSVKFVEDLLSVGRVENAEAVPKYVALKSIAESIGVKCDPAPLAVSFRDGPNRIGVEQSACIQCGNCVTGCNTGAKNTLAMNAWPRARQLGVTIYTGASVRAVSRTEDPAYPWKVHGRVTAQEDFAFTVMARRVILAAGTLGSTEILLRSKQEQGLGLSDQLGKRFSGNGDMLAFGYGQEKLVKAGAPRPSVVGELTREEVGPTIVGYLKAATPQVSGSQPGSMVTIEDGAVPYALVRFWQEIVTTQGFFYRYTKYGLPAWFEDHPHHDPLAVSNSLKDHCQVLLVMGDDGARGTLDIKRTGYDLPDKSGLSREDKRKIIEDATSIAGHTQEMSRELVLSWPEANDEPVSVLTQIHKVLGKAQENGGFDGGIYLPNPIWKAFPDQLEGVVEGTDAIGGQTLTVHPLGGCCMGNSAADGVVNLNGQVFTGADGPEVYEGLYVLDGSIIPQPLGINPFLTIAALAHYLACKIDRPGVALVRSPSAAILDELNARRPKPKGYQLGDPRDERVDLHFKERLFGQINSQHLEGIRQTLGISTEQALLLIEHRGCVIDVDIALPDAYAWLEDPSQALKARFEISANQRRNESIDTVPHDFRKDGPIVCAEGSVRMFALDQPRGRLKRYARAISALLRFARYRWREIGQNGPRSDTKSTLCEKIRGYWRTAKVHAEYRRLIYTFAHDFPTGTRLEFTGEKTLSYALCGENVWTVLTQLKPTLRFRNRSESFEASANLRVDLAKLSRDLAPFQAVRSPNAPTTLAAVGSILGLFIRGLVQTHFWTFAAPTYRSFKPKEEANAAGQEQPPPKLAYSQGEAQLDMRFVCKAETQETATLVRYRPTHCSSRHQPLLMIHGGAHSSRVFWTETTDTNMVKYFLNQGFDVWLLDYRTSTIYPERMDLKATMDTVAEKDIPWAVRKIFDEHREPVDVFAHCVGAGCFAMAVLSGKLQTDSQRSMIKSATIHAVTPWLVASELNRIRANVLALFRGRMSDAIYDPIPHRDSSIGYILADRLANSIPWSESQRRLHVRTGDEWARTVCNRMSLFYGIEYLHGNLAPDTHRRLAEHVGAAPAEFLRQVYFCIIRSRITDRDGRNAYLQTESLRKYWTFPTLFVHGQENGVFNVEGSRRSAYLLARSRFSAKSHNNMENWEKHPDYGEQKVWLYTIPEYGHMDVLFGREANTKVHRIVNAFFEQNQEILRDYAKPSQSDRPHLDDAARPFGTDGQAVCGPVISNLKVDDGKRVISVWLETDEFQTNSDTKVMLRRNGEAIPLHLHRAMRSNEVDRNGNSAYCSVDLELPKDLDTSIELFVNTSYSASVNDPTVVLPIPRLTLIAGQEDHQPLDWYKLPWFKHIGEVGADKVSFLAGSCLYPGLSVDFQLSDRVFMAMQPHIKGEVETGGVDHLLMLGDTIYADATAELFDTKDLYEKYRERYRRAFGGHYSDLGANAHWVLSHLPTYFALDDHEIDDNWSGEDPAIDTDNDARARARLRALRIARQEARNFLSPQADNDPIKRDAKYAFYRSFESRGFQFKILDTRTERQRIDRGQRSALLSDAQMQDFDAWLGSQRVQADIASQRPVFVASGSPVGPLPSDIHAFPALYRNDDTLLGYPGFLDELLDRLVNRGVKRLIWLAGDAHVSSYTNICLEKAGAKVLIHQICASGLYAPLPFINDRIDRYAWNKASRFDLPNTKIIYTSTPSLLTGCSSHFVRVDVDPVHDNDWRIGLTAVDSEGNQLKQLQFDYWSARPMPVVRVA